MDTLGHPHAQTRSDIESLKNDSTYNVASDSNGDK